MRDFYRGGAVLLLLFSALSLPACEGSAEGQTSDNAPAQPLPTLDVTGGTTPPSGAAQDLDTTSGPDVAAPSAADVARNPATDTEAGPSLDVITASPIDITGGQEQDGASPGTTNPDPVDPFGPGDYSIVTYEANVIGANGKTFEAILIVPEGAESRPVVIFLPGFMLSGPQFSSSAEALARHGFITLLPSFGDSILNAIDHVDLAEHTSGMIDWLEAHNAMSDSLIYGLVDVDRVGAAGHSRGGKTALLTAVQDDRIDAVYTLDPVDAVGGPGDSAPTPANPSVTPELMGDLTVPVGFFGAGLGAEGLSPCAPTEDNHAAYFQYADAAEVAYHHVDANAGHLDFTDDGGGLTGAFCAKGDDPAGTRAAAIGTMVAFFRAHLANQPGYTPWLAGDLVAEGITWEKK